MFQKIDAGDLSARYALKKRAQYNMSWYLTNVYPELGIPQIHGLAWGEVSVQGISELCRTICLIYVQCCLHNMLTTKAFVLNSKEIQVIRLD